MKTIERFISASTGPHFRFNLRVLAVKSGVSAHTLQGSMEALLYPSYLTKYGVQFIHVPKAAGTSVALALYDRLIPHHSAAYYHCVNSNRFKEVSSFSVVRDPIQRFKSSFRFLISGGTELVKVRKPTKYKRFQQSRDINRFIKEWLVRQKSLDFTLMPQSDFIFSKNNELLVKNLFDLSDLDTCARFLSEKLGKEISLPRVNSTSDYANTDLDADSIGILREFYSRDYDLINKHIGNIWYGG